MALIHDEPVCVLGSMIDKRTNATVGLLSSYDRWLLKSASVELHAFHAFTRQQPCQCVAAQDDKEAQMCIRCILLARDKTYGEGRRCRTKGECCSG